MFWVGSEAPIEGHRPNFWAPFNDALSGNARVDRILGWLDLPAGKRPTLLTLYINDVDGAGHSSGPEVRGRADRPFAARTVTWAACCAAWSGAT